MPSDQRLHPASILFGLGAQIRYFAAPVVLLLISTGSVGRGWEVWALPLLIPAALASLVRYLSFRYRYEAHEMVLRSGLLFRNERHIPYARIQNIDGVQNVLHRLLGVVEARVETGGGGEAEARLSVLPLAAFEEMRRRVFAGKAEEGTAADPAAAAVAPGRTLLALSPRELILCGLIENRGFVVVSAAFGLLWELGLLDRLADRAFGEQASGRGVARALLAALVGRGELPWGRIGLALAAFVAFLLLIRLISMGWTLLRLYGFRITRDGEDLRTEHGLLTRVVATVPLRRIQALTVREGPLHRLFGRVSVRVDTAGSDGGEEGKSQREWLAPILHRDELPAFLREVLPELDLASATWQAAPPRAFRRELKGAVLVAVLMSLPFVVPLKGWALAPLALLLGWAFAGARLTVLHLGWAVTGGAVLFRSGWAWRQISVAPFAKIQAVAVHESPFDRRAAMARVRVDTAGVGDASHRVDIPYLPRETARDLSSLLAAQAARTALRW